jgi:hypothetical protein
MTALFVGALLIFFAGWVIVTILDAKREKEEIDKINAQRPEEIKKQNEKELENILEEREREEQKRKEKILEEHERELARFRKKLDKSAREKLDK